MQPANTESSAAVHAAARRAAPARSSSAPCTSRPPGQAHEQKQLGVNEAARRKLTLQREATNSIQVAREKVTHAQAKLACSPVGRSSNSRPTGGRASSSGAVKKKVCRAIRCACSWVSAGAVLLSVSPRTASTRTRERSPISTHKNLMHTQISGAAACRKDLLSH